MYSTSLSGFGAVCSKVKPEIVPDAQFFASRQSAFPGRLIVVTSMPPPTRRIPGLKTSFSWNVPGPTFTVSPNRAASMAAWTVVYWPGTVKILGPAGGGTVNVGIAVAAGVPMDFHIDPADGSGVAEASAVVSLPG